MLNLSDERHLKNTLKWLPNHQKNEMLVFGLCSTSDDRPCNLSNKSHPKCKKWLLNHQKNEMLVFGLHSTSDDWLSNPSNESCLKCKKMATKSSKNEMLSLDYVQLLMIS